MRTNLRDRKMQKNLKWKRHILLVGISQNLLETMKKKNKQKCKVLRKPCGP